MKPWERNWQAPKSKPWERQWGAPGQAEEVPDWNMARGAYEGLTRNIGGLAGFVDTGLDHLMENYTGGLVSTEGEMLPSWEGPEDYARIKEQAEADGRYKDPVESFEGMWKDTDAGYVPNHTAGKLKQTYQKNGLFDPETLKEGLMFGLETGTVSLSDMFAVSNPVTAIPYVLSRSEQGGQTRAENQGRDDAEWKDVVEYGPAAVGSALLERLGVKGITGAGKDVAQNTGEGIIRNTLKEGSKAALKEGSTEAIQEGGIEYLGETLGTDKDPSLAEALERGMFGAIGGGVYGGAAGGAVALPRSMAAGNQNAAPDADQGPTPTPEPVAEAVSAQVQQPAAQGGFVQRTATPMQQGPVAPQVSQQQPVQMDQSAGPTLPMDQQAVQATPMQMERRTDTERRGEPRADSTGRRRFKQPYEVQLDEYNAKADQYQLTPEQREAFTPQERRDKQTGFVKAEEHEATIDRAKEHVSETGENAHYVEMDIRNLGGLNETLGHTEADGVFQGIASIIREEVEAVGGETGGDAVMIRHGGDEMSIVAVNSNQGSLNNALNNAKKRVNEYIKKQGLSDIVHPKDKDNPNNRGVGIYYGVSEIDPDLHTKDITKKADLQVERGKKSDGVSVTEEATNNVNTNEIEAPGAVASAEQSGPAAESDAGPGGSDRSQVRGSEASTPETEQNVELTEDSEIVKAYREMEDAIRGGGKLSANPFLDPEFLKPMAKVVKAAFGMPVKKLDQWMGGVSESFKEYRNLSGEQGHRSIRQQVGWIGRMFVQSNDGMLRGLASKYNSPTIEKIADMFFSVAGEGNSTGRTYHEAVEQRIMTKLTELDKALKSHMGNESSMEQITALLRNPENIRKGTPIHDAADKLRIMLKDELEYMRESGLDVGEVTDGYFPRIYDVAGVLGNTAKFVNKAADAYMKTYPEITREEALSKAEAWRDNLLLADAGVKTQGSDFATISGGAPTPNNTKARAFNKEAEALLSEFMISSPVDALTSYFMRSARRAEWERRLGQGKWQEMKQQMIDEGAYGAIDDVVKTIQSSAGFMPSQLNPSTNNVFSLVRLANALTFLSHATLTSVSEIVMPAVRTGDTRTILRSAYMSAKSLFNTESRQEIEEITTDLLGVTGKIAIDTLMQQRVGGTFDSKKMQHVTNRFFTATGLHHFTEATRIAAADLGMSFIQRLSKEVSTNHRRKKSSSLLLKEMGVPDNKMDEFVKFVSEHENMSRSDLESNAEMQEIYGLALTRFLDQSIMRPNASHKPRYANHPVGSLFYALQSFLYSFSKNVSIRNMKLLKEGATGTDYTLSDRMALAMPMGMMLLPIAIQFALVDARDDLFDDGTDDERERSNGDRMMTAVSRSGILGAVDVYANLMSGLRYDKDPATTALGPELGLVSEAFDSLVTVMDPNKNSENTNTAERNATKKFYDVAVKPTLTFGASLMPYRTGAPLIQAIHHPAAREQVMQGIAGEKGEKAGKNKGLRGGGFRGESLRDGGMRGESLRD